MVAVALLAANTKAFGEKAPSFTGSGLDGAPVSLEDYLGKVPILLDFGSIYCSSCVTSIPHLMVLQNKYGTERLRVVGINLDTYGISRVRRFFSSFQKNLNFPILLDVELKISRPYDVNVLPTYVLIGKDGEIKGRFVGYDDEIEKKLDEAVRALVEGGVVEAPPADAAPDVVLLTPENFTKTLQDSITVIGLTGGRDGSFTLRLNGGSEKAAKNVGKMFSVRTPLSLGSNFIEVRYPKGSTNGTLAVVLFREQLMGEGLQASFPLFQFHTPDREGRCAACHEMNPKGGESVAAATTFCLRCHDYLTSQPFVHGPIPVGGCNPCHDLNSKPHRYDLITEGAELCFTCHDDVRSQFAKPYMHGPVAMGLCAVCHSPHGSAFKYQLRNAQGDLCLSCHEQIKAKASMFVQHSPFKNGRCTDCHDPHASDNATFFLKAKGEDLCELCHPIRSGKLAHKHPVGRAPAFSVKGMKLDGAGNLTCFSCHDPHASDSDRMSPVPGGCSGCHKI